MMVIVDLSLPRVLTEQQYQPELPIGRYLKA
jgi:hypothetical protein